ncbi:hypothetical protein C482_02711 [Natrialba chahannaoensis JCM 10990]|uniref:Uncharacterized protein n=1 Tax=Natrialba chahannaoensis JCM 10990 TaxID=1227492 RepID=M0B2N3_9EURY|nr:hypothetical protein [Natrialba chahannaoensis]ELZ05030.1 hypothetical protein C482_02711 [Natrialba chahannaoensis JCM 10990]
MLEYYDKILIGIAGSVLGGVFLSVVTALTFQTGLLLGSVVATLFLYDAMFRHPPLPATDPRVAAMAIVWHAVLIVFALTTVC